MPNMMMNKLIKTLLITAIAVTTVFFHGCGRKKIQEQPAVLPTTTPEKITTPPYVTVWVHGTTMFGPLKRLHSSPPGLMPSEALPNAYHLKKTIRCLCRKDPEHFELNHFYTFGWSGKLSLSEREEVAKELYQTLVGLVDRYAKQYGTSPCLRLITHSHGGNVALNLVRANTNNRLCIDELILLACPVQHATKELVHNPMFKRIYALYSDADLIQVLDPQGIHDQEKKQKKEPGIFSHRHFPTCDRLVQARIKLRGRAPFHAEFVMDHFVQELPAIIKKLSCEKSSDKPILIRC